MSNNQGDAATPAREREPEQTQTADIIENAQGAQSATSQPATSDTAENVGQSQAEPQRTTDVQNEAEGSLAFTAQQSGNPQAAQTAATATPQPTGDQSEGVANSAGITGGTNAQTGNDTRTQSEAKPDVSDQDWQELVPKLMAEFNNNREQLARAIGLHRSTVDRWLNGKSRPNNSTVLRMRRLMQERRIE